MNRALIIAVLLLPLLAWGQVKPTASLPPEESRVQLQRLGDSLRKYDRFENFDRYGWMVVEKVAETNHHTYSSDYGIINDKGQTILPCEYSCIRFQDHSDLIMVAKNSHSAGFMNRQLEWVIPPEFSESLWCDLETDNLFSHGMIVVEDGSFKYGVVDSFGNEVLPCRYQWLEIAGPDLYVINEDKAGVINQNGDTVIPFVYEYLRFLGNNSFEARKQGQCGVISTSGREILPFVYESILACDKGLYSVSQNGKWGVVDSLGNVVIPLKYETQHIWFVRGMDLVEMGGLYMNNGMDRDDPEKCKLLNKNGEVLIQGYDASIPGKSGERIAVLFYNEDRDATCEIYDRNGKKLDAFDEFSFDGIDWVNDVTMIPVKRNGKWGFVNRDFELIVPCQYDGQAHGGHGYGTVTTLDKQQMLIEETGDTLVTGPYRWICPSVNGWFQVETISTDPYDWEGLSGFIDRYGNCTFTETAEPGRKVLMNQDLIDDDENLVPFADMLPEFPGGLDSLNAYLARTIQYPQDARNHGVSGTVLAEFVVEKDGHVREVTIKVPLFPSCDEEVTRALLQMPEWKPGTNQGLPVRFFMQVPIIFKNDTLYPKLITDTALINTLTAMLRNKSFSQKDYHWLNLEEGDFYSLKNFYVVRSMLVGPTGWSSNFQHYLIIDTTKHTDFYFMSLSDAINNVYLNGDLYVNRVSYKDWFNEDADYFHRKKATFKLIRTTLSPADLQIKTETETEKTLRWEEAYGWRFH